jgi:hypothetical protein
MTESPEPRTEPTSAETAPPASRAAALDRAYYPHSRLNAVLAWVGIIAGVVFIVAVVFFSGFALGRHAGGGHHGWHHHHWQGAGMSHHGGPGMGPWWSRGGQGGAGGPGMMGPGGAGGPGNPYGPGGTQSPTTAPSATPHP